MVDADIERQNSEPGDEHQQVENRDQYHQEADSHRLHERD